MQSIKVLTCTAKTNYTSPVLKGQNRKETRHTDDRNYTYVPPAPIYDDTPLLLLYP